MKEEGMEESAVLKLFSRTLPAEAKPPISIQEQLSVVEREIALRRRVYPKLVASGKMSQNAADYQLQAMCAVLKTVNLVKLTYEEMARRNSGLSWKGGVDGG
jgi:hypothetical protein